MLMACFTSQVLCAKRTHHSHTTHHVVALEDSKVPQWQVGEPKLLKSSQSPEAAPSFEVEARMDIRLAPMKQMVLPKAPFPFPTHLPSNYRDNTNYTKFGMKDGETGVLLTSLAGRLRTEDGGYIVRLPTL